MAESYDYRNGRFYTGMCVLEVLLADQPDGAGGLCIVPGSHKSNMAAPKEVKDYSMYRHTVQQVVAKAGDAILFPEAGRPPRHHVAFRTLLCHCAISEQVSYKTCFAY